MTLDEFAALSRLPTSEELSALCEELGIKFGTTPEGQPALKTNADNGAEAKVLVKILKREPWRSQVIAAKGLDRKPDKNPADWQAAPEPMASPPVVQQIEAPALAQGEFEVLHVNGKITTQETKPAPPSPGMYYRQRGELGWTVIPLRERG